MKIKRLDEENWEKTHIMNVSFASLILSDENNPLNKFNLRKYTYNFISIWRFRFICKHNINV